MRATRVVALLPVFNDARYLPGWLSAVGSCVDAVVALDDGSTDESLSLLRASSVVSEVICVSAEDKDGWNEPKNRELLVSAGQRHGADWFVAFDADERPESRLWTEWARLTARADQEEATAISQPLREIWDSADQYRSDGVWNRKRKAAIFRNLGSEHSFDPARWHGEWYSMGHPQAVLEVDINLYHLKMLHAADRYGRMLRYKRLDPNNDFQAVGYDYLTDEAGIQLTPIPASRRYQSMSTETVRPA